MTRLDFSHRTVRAVLITLSAGAFAALPALAAGDGVEITPIATFQTGSSFEATDFEFGPVDVDLKSSEDFGVLVDIPLNRHFQIELLYLDQSTEIELDQGLLFPGFSLGSIKLETAHAGVLWQGAAGQLKPFFVMTAGVTRLNPEDPFIDSETAFSMTLGGGVKAFVTRHIGFRLDGRLFVAALDTGNQRRHCCGDEGGSGFASGLVTAGVIFAF